MQYRIIYLGNEQSDFSVSFLRALHKLGLKIELVISSRKNVLSRKKNIISKIWFASHYYTIFEVFDIIKLKICKKSPFSRLLVSKNVLSKYSLSYVCKKLGYKYINCDSINDKRTRNRIMNVKPDLILVHAFGEIIKKDIISIPRKGVINFHPGALPSNQGATPVEWTVLKHLSKATTCCHKVSEGIDSGNIILCKSSTLAGVCAWKDVNTRSMLATRKALKEFSLRLRKNKLTSKSQPKKHMIYNPRANAWQKYKIRILSRFIYRFK